MKSSILYVLISPYSENSYWWINIKRGILKAALEYKYEIVYISSEMLSEQSGLRGKMVLVIGHHTAWIDENIERLFALRAIPVLANTSMFPSHRRVCSGVILGLEDAMLDAISYLEKCGRKRIVFLGTNPNSISDRIKCDIFGRPDDIIRGSEGIEKCVDKFVGNFSELGYDAALCANDTVAIYLIRRMKEQGYRIPEELFVIGMGNSFIGQGMETPLASIDFNYYEMGKAAVELFHLIESSSSEYNMILTLQSKLVIRESAKIPHNIDKETQQKHTNSSIPMESRYFDGGEVKNILSIETFLQSCDPIDSKILVALMRNVPIKKIAEETFLGERAVRYRIKNFIDQRGFKDREELMSYLRSAILKQ